VSALRDFFFFFCTARQLVAANCRFKQPTSLRRLKQQWPTDTEQPMIALQPHR
jgi:hypothetical protein